MSADNADSMSYLFPHSETFKLDLQKRTQIAQIRKLNLLKILKLEYMSRKMSADNADSLSNLFPHSETFKLGPSKRNADCADSEVEPSQKL